MLSGGEVAGLIVAVFWAVLVCFLAYVLVKVGQVLKEAARLVSGMTEQTLPLLGEVTTTVSTTNAQLVRVDTITSNVQSITTNASALTSVFAATLGGPLIKAAAFSYGVRRALRDRHRQDVTKRVQSELKAERRARRAARRGRA
jgi:predicted PurR-regulated permease PerM